jgi:alginate O-acetyltransferase complex protein AlgJ
MSTVEPGQIDLPAPVFDSKYIRGKNGWLFLDEDANRVLDQHTGQLQFTPAELDRWRRVLENRVAWLAQRGMPYHFLVAPNAHAVYEEHLPDDVKTSSERPVLQLLGHLQQTGSDAGLIYPLEQLRRRREQAVYPRTATHWSELGAFIAYEVLMDEVVKTLDVPRLSEDDIEWVEEEIGGDLGFKLDPVEYSALVYGDLKVPHRARLVSDNRVKRNGRRVEFEGDPDAAHTCLVVADSFAVRVVPFLAESFRRLVFAHIPTLDYALVEEVRPDIVLTILNERFLVEIPEDVGAPDLGELEEQKRASKEMLAPRKVETNRLNAPR